MKPTIYLNRFKHGNTALIKLFSYENGMIEDALQALSYVYYSHHYRCYYIRDRPELIKKLRYELREHAYISDKYINPETLQELYKQREALAIQGNENTPNNNRVLVRCIQANNNCYLQLPHKHKWAVYLQELGCQYESKRRIWIVPEYEKKIRVLKRYFNGEGCRFLEQARHDDKKSHHLKRQDYKQDMDIQDYIKILTLQGASKRTIENYASQIKKLKDYYEGKPVSKISDEEIRDYLFFLREELSYSWSAQNIVVSAVKRYILSMTEREINELLIPRPVTKKTLPKVLEKEEIEAILRQNIFIKHKCLLYLLYATGIRCGELINLKVEDVKFDTHVIEIKKGKGDKGRIVSMPDKLKHLLLAYFRREKPSIFVFEGQNGGKYSPSSVQRVVRKAVVKAGIDKRVTPHMLRHSFATHLHDSGMDIRNIQKLLGHSSTKTTEIYTYISKRDISKLKSPLDDLDV
ncbi:site-specific tyrosine recombinase/integron integrase [Carboxylicivirga marina]|uniref:Tyrosine-type recombinase/integrase n=1 Tax=Carboxylicivirga marina TaxID=2800988 RepID=A0ABS1HQH3_9BACT|nr:site-specific tyrosine recombinase/integron integrase [Carboxylicivirga marina]MBK3519923.1 tyrosine-type recombinase/integrase [Carboxylicivirga marina]